MPKPILPVAAPETPVTALYAPSVGKGSRYIGSATRDEIWAIAKRIWGDDIPSKTAWAIWGAPVVDARRVENCSQCEWVGDIFMLCDYHRYRECECGAILGTLTQCKCDEGD